MSTPDELREALADLAHQQWAGWMEYLFQKAHDNGDGTVTIPAAYVARWLRQIGTPYAGLSRQEQDSDRLEADKVLELLRRFQ